MIFHIYCNTLAKLTNLKIRDSHSSVDKYSVIYQSSQHKHPKDLNINHQVHPPSNCLVLESKSATHQAKEEGLDKSHFSQIPTYHE